MVLVDTSVWVDFIRGERSGECEHLDNLINMEADLALSGIILTEILQGFKSDTAFNTYKSFLLDFPIYDPKNFETYLNAAQIYRACRKKGKTVRKTVDCVIAAICIENDLTLLHKDGDFDVIEKCAGLKCYKT